MAKANPGSDEKEIKKIFQNAVDENDEVLHNLASLLLTNTTLRSDADNTAGQGKMIFNN